MDHAKYKKMIERNRALHSDARYYSNFRRHRAFHRTEEKISYADLLAFEPRMFMVEGSPENKAWVESQKRPKPEIVYVDLK